MSPPSSESSTSLKRSNSSKFKLFKRSNSESSLKSPKSPSIFRSKSSLKSESSPSIYKPNQSKKPVCNCTDKNGKKCNCTCKCDNQDQEGGSETIDTEIRDKSKDIVSRLENSIGSLKDMFKQGIATLPSNIRDEINVHIPSTEKPNIDTVSLDVISAYLKDAAEERSRWQQQLDLLMMENKKLENRLESMQNEQRQVPVQQPEPVVKHFVPTSINSLVNLINKNTSFSAIEKINIIAYVIGYESQLNLSQTFDQNYQQVFRQCQLPQSDVDLGKSFSNHYNAGIEDYKHKNTKIYNEIIEKLK